MAGIPNPGENAGWIGDIENAIFWLIGVATLIIGGAVRIITGQAKRIDKLETEAAHDRETFTTALKASIEDRRALFASSQDLHAEHAKIRETLAGQPSKEDLQRVEDRLGRLIQGRLG